MSERTCTHHESAPAIAVCAECGEDICGECHTPDERGFAVCPPCRGRSPAWMPAWERPETRYRPAAYLRTAWHVLRYSRQFFAGFDKRGAWMPAAVFGYVAALIGILGARLWQVVLDPSFGETLSEFAATRAIPIEQLRTLVVASTPLSALIAFVAHVVALRAATQVAGGSMSWRGAIRIGGYSMGATLFLVLPPVYGFEIGVLLAIFWLFNLETGALRSLYEIDGWRASLTVLLPVLVLVTCAG